jgi:hypothetical protein
MNVERSARSMNPYFDRVMRFVESRSMDVIGAAVILATIGGICFGIAAMRSGGADPFAQYANQCWWTCRDTGVQTVQGYTCVCK